MRKALTLTLIIAVAVLASANSAGAVADLGGGGSGGTIWAWAERDGGVRPLSTGSRPASCGAWTLVSGLEWAEGGTIQFFSGKPYALYYRECPAGSANRQYTWVPLVRDPVDLANLAFDQVKQRLPKPRAGFAPPAANGVVQIGTWFWTTSATWKPVSATAYIPGLSATVTATPTRLRFNPGDGSWGTGEVSCPGPGPVWTPAVGDEAASPCMYTFRHASSLSPSGTWNTTLTIDWDVRFTASTGASRSMGQLRTSASAPLRVGEIQAVLTNG